MATWASFNYHRAMMELKNNVKIIVYIRAVFLNHPLVFSRRACKAMYQWLSQQHSDRCINHIY